VSLETRLDLGESAVEKGYLIVKKKSDKPFFSSELIVHSFPTIIGNASREFMQSNNENQN